MNQPIVSSQTDKLMEKQCEMLTELIAITRDCVQACRLVLHRGETANSRINIKSPAVVTRRGYRPSDPKAEKEMQRAKLLFLEGRTRSEIAKELNVPYSTVCQFIRGYAGKHFNCQKRKQ